MAPRLEMSHSGELKPMMHTPCFGFRPSWREREERRGDGLGGFKSAADVYSLVALSTNTLYGKAYLKVAC